MASKRKQLKLEEESTLFLKPDIVFELEGKQLHVRKQVLAENSPVFKQMFKSAFKEKREERIPLPGKKYKDFEMFLRAFYHPAFTCPITKDTVLSILPLAEEYQVVKVKARCERCMIETLQLHTQGIPQIDTRTLLLYAAFADLYNLPSVVPLAVQMCAKYDEQLLKQAGSEVLSERMLIKIAQERNKLLQNFAIRKIQKGDATMVLETLQILSGLVDKKRIALMKEYKDKLVAACTYDPDKDWYAYTNDADADMIVEFIVAAEKFNLKNLLSSAIRVARGKSRSSIQKSKLFNEMSDKSKIEIYE